MVHIHNGILLNHNHKQDEVICRDVTGPRECHTEWSVSQQKKTVSY